jgi:signal transduction histidine kinase
VSGLLIYVSLYWVVRRASAIMRAQQKRLIDAETLSTIGAMASAMAHGIRNPLASIRSSAELALEEEASDFHKELAGGIVTEVDRLEQWVRKLIMLAHPEQDELGSACVNTAIRKTLETFAQTMKTQGVVLALDLEEQLPPVPGNSLIMEQVFQNLISNALDAMPQGGTLTIQARAANDGDQVEMKVIDTGVGMPEDHLAQIFKPFVTSKRTGLGLGLSLVRQLVERLNGTIALSSREGHGTTASLRFPGVLE